MIYALRRWYTKSATWIKKYCRKCILFCSIFWWPIREFAPPCKASDAEAAEQCFVPDSRVENDIKFHTFAFAWACSITWIAKNKRHSVSAFCFLVTHPGIEPEFPAWEASVLTAWPMGLAECLNIISQFLSNVNTFLKKSLRKMRFFRYFFKK